MTATIKPILKYPGAKWNLAQWIISHFPTHIHYVEPFFGSGAVFFNKPAVQHEVINDLSGDVVNLFRVIRNNGEELAALIEITPWSREEYQMSYTRCDEPVEAARRFLVSVCQSHGSGSLVGRNGWRCAITPDRSLAKSWCNAPDRIHAVIDRLKGASIENDTAVAVIKRYASSAPLIYADPPYPSSTRNGKLYQHEMTDSDHLELLDVLDAHPGPVVLSGYHCPLYDDRLAHWQTVEKQTQAEKGNTRTEVLWLNRKARKSQMSLFDL